RLRLRAPHPPGHPGRIPPRPGSPGPRRRCPRPHPRRRPLDGVLALLRHVGVPVREGDLLLLTRRDERSGVSRPMVSASGGSRRSARRISTFPAHEDIAMTRRLLAAAAVAFLAVAACDGKKTTPNGPKPSDSVEPGVALFVYADYSKAQTGDRSADPIMVRWASVVILKKADVPSGVDGTIWWVGTEFDAATSPALKPTDKFTHPRDKKVYRRIMPGDFVKKDQVIGLLDDEQAFVEHRGALAKQKAAQEEAKAYEETVKNLGKIVEQEAMGLRTGAVPLQEYYS